MNSENRNSQSDLFGAVELSLISMEGEQHKITEAPEDSINNDLQESLSSDEVGLFSTTANKWFQPGGIGAPVNLTYSFSDFGDFNGITSEEAKAAIAEAFSLWSSVAPLHFTEVDASSSDAQIIISQDAIDGAGGTLAFAFFPSVGDITFDSGENWTPSTFLEAAVHELGHSLGLGHEEHVEAILNPSIQHRFEGLGSSFLLQDDIDGIQNLYGSGIGSVTVLDNNVFPPETTDSTIIATEEDDILIGDDQGNQIVGLGGNDYIEGRFGLDVIDGSEGIDTVSYNYTFAGFTWDMNTDTLHFHGGGSETVRNVENVIGSQGNDRITGNNFNNTIEGSGGADTFVFNSLDSSIDTIRDYSLESGDRLEIVRSGFGTGEFTYDPNSGGLFYEEQQFAILENKPDFDSVSSGLIGT